MKEEKPEYGWYVKSLIIYFFIFGLIGLILLFVGLYISGILAIILIITGICLIVLFLWPSIGLSAINITIGNEFNLDQILRKASDIKSPEILDIGCGTGRTVIKLAKKLKNGGHITGIDIYSEFAISGNSLETVQRNARIEKVLDKTTFMNGSATKIPFENDKFDIVTLSSVLHELHSVEEQELAMIEINRVLKNQGILYIGEWNRKSWQSILYMGIWCLIFKTRKYWQKLIEKHGFQEIRYKNTGGFGHFIAKKP